MTFVRETEAGGCAVCGENLSQWEHGISIEAALAAIHADPTLLEPMLVRTCRRCGAPYEWNLTIKDDDLGDEPAAGEAARGSLLAIIREQLAQGVGAATGAEQIRRELGVTGILIEDGSEVGRRIRRVTAAQCGRTLRSPDRLRPWSTD